MLTSIIVATFPISAGRVSKGTFTAPSPPGTLPASCSRIPRKSNETMPPSFPKNAPNKDCRPLSRFIPPPMPKRPFANLWRSIMTALFPWSMASPCNFAMPATFSAPPRSFSIIRENGRQVSLPLQRRRRPGQRRHPARPATGPRTWIIFRSKARTAGATILRESMPMPRWAQLVRHTLERKGKIIIPAFSVGRTQQIVYTLHQLTLAGQLPRVPIFVDSPLSVNATEIYRFAPGMLQ